MSSRLFLTCAVAIGSFSWFAPMPPSALQAQPPISDYRRLHNAGIELGSADPKIREAAAETLIAGGERALTQLRMHAYRSEPDLAKRTIEVLKTMLQNARKAEDEAFEIKVLGVINRMVAHPKTEVSEFAKQAYESELPEFHLQALGDLKESGAIIQNRMRSSYSGLIVTGAGQSKFLKDLVTAPSVGFQGAEITDVDLLQLPAIRDLEMVTLTGTNVTEKGIEKLASLASLRSVTIMNQEVTPEMLTALSAAKQMMSLSVSTTLGGDHLAALAECKQIRMLSVQGLDAAATEFQALRNAVPNLQISCRMTKPTDQQIQALAAADEVYSLSISDASEMSDQTWESLSGLQVRSLSVTGTELSEDACLSISQINGLQTFMVHGAKLSKESVYRIIDASDLRSLYLNKVEMSKEEISKVVKQLDGRVSGLIGSEKLVRLPRPLPIF